MAFVIWRSLPNGDFEDANGRAAHVEGYEFTYPSTEDSVQLIDLSVASYKDDRGRGGLLVLETQRISLMVHADAPTSHARRAS